MWHNGREGVKEDSTHIPHEKIICSTAHVVNTMYGLERSTCIYASIHSNMGYLYDLEIGLIAMQLKIIIMVFTTCM